mmetsp:Transcript_4290/g.10462  ORF Transcript_4290/g.10462 Transcript_4290/m.10462 type:complete len:305 (+) Transcript_4290:260-1174(+)|eukprot:CAMPEP_0179000004 /NCGR_PEP_ID=MMETSP0795-20121207/10413_1 /TAXON_ID=88552 /ORGANISM="Amoebophrya sp., Strain Ameob2" /LENGTH=304 /DNA_ID=CAMNT_0020692917 /DNA_START=221 /DNA_END=1132 /DNA_ORIENTATION=-
MGEDWEDDSDVEPPKKQHHDSDEDDWDKSEGEQEAARKAHDSDDDDDWDADKTKPEPIVAVPAGVEPPAKTGANAKPKDEVYIPLADAAAEKARQRRLQEQSDALLGEELFAGFVKAEAIEEPAEAAASTTSCSSPSKKAGGAGTVAGFSPSKCAVPEKPKVRDDWDEVNFDTQDKVIKVMNDAMAKLEAVEAKAYMKGCNNQFLLKLLLCVGDKITLKEAQELEKKVKEIIRVRKVETAAAQAAKKKINEINKNTKFDVKNALDERYGAGDEDWDEDEEWGEGDWGEGDWGEGNWGEGKEGKW